MRRPHTTSTTTILITLGLLLLYCLPTTTAIETTLTSTTITVTVAAPTSPLSPTYTSPTDLQSSILNSTNFYRYEHNAPFLSWNSTLALYASNYAQKCTWAHSHGPYGENLARGYPDIPSAVDAWGNERSLYDFSTRHPTGFTEATGHFTQLVWKATRQTGCAAVDCASSLGGVLVVCEYYPAGNIVGDDDVYFLQNVQGQVNQGQGFDYAAATSGVGGPGVTGTASGSGGATGTATGSALQPGNTMGAASGLVLGRGKGGSGKGWCVV